MNWLFIAIIFPVGLAIVNHIDKYLIDKLFRSRPNGTLAIISGSIGLPSAFLIWILFQPPLFLAIDEIFTLLLTGIIYTFALIPYFNALEQDEASVISPLALMIPLIALVLDFTFLGILPTSTQLVGGMIILVGSLLLSLEIDNWRRLKIKNSILFYMTIFSFLLASNGFLFKLIAIETSYWTALFWTQVGVSFAAVLLYVFNPKYRLHFNETLATHSYQAFSLNAVNEFLAVISQAALHKASLMAPLGILFFFTEGIQPFFVILFGILITLLFPKISQENLTSKYLAQKILAVSIMIIGTYFISR